MKHITKFICALLLTVANSAFAQTNNIMKEESFIEVTGRSEKEVVPNEIFIHIIILEKTSGREKMSVEAQEEKLKTALKQIGINPNNLSLADADAEYISVSWSRKDLVTKKEYNLKVSTAAAVGQVFEELDKLDIKGAYIVRISHSKIDSLNKEVRIAAIKAAKEQSDYLLKAIGEQTGKTLVVQEREEYNNKPLQSSKLNIRGGRSAVTTYYVDGVNTDENVVQFQKIKIQSVIYVKFAIK
jgi:uncharacterized protein